MPRMVELPSSDVLQHLVDVHCHPTNAPHISLESMERLQITVCSMARREADQITARNLTTAYPSKVIPCFDMPFLRPKDRYNPLVLQLDTRNCLRLSPVLLLYHKISNGLEGRSLQTSLPGSHERNNNR